MGVKVLTSALAMMVPAVALAAHPLRTIQPDGVATRFQFVGAPGANGLTYARQVVAPSTKPIPTSAAQTAPTLIYLNHDPVTLVPGDNNAMTGASSIVTEPVDMSGWYTDDGTWADTLGCVQEIYSRFNVTITDQDPGTTPHIMAVVGGSPLDVGLPDNVAGVSPFTEDCGIIDSSIVFTFTDVLPDDAQTVCEVMSQEIAHSFGLDHEMEPSDPMTYLDYDGDREFQDQDTPCGEYADRPCGIAGHMCRPSQNSVQLLMQRAGVAGGGTMPAPTPNNDDGGMMGVGCSAGNHSGFGALALVLVALLRRRR